ncbi:hypothetical protein [Bartonella sp. CM31XJBT]|uniref:hypothetical protein n=1 Tax=Bartonella sp. CM31XJBT TaxID=3019090 RepID=UPI00235DF38C|nr:hypothetical protein [Bartonella sp. CM31XJBT]
MGAPPWGKEIVLSLKWLLLYLHTLGALTLLADVNIWQLSHKSFMEDESFGFEKNIEKINLGRFCC